MNIIGGLAHFVGTFWFLKSNWAIGLIDARGNSKASLHNLRPWPKFVIEKVCPRVVKLRGDQRLGVIQKRKS